MKVSKPFMPEDYMTLREALEVAAEREKRIAELEAVLRHIARISTQDCSKGGVFTIFLEIEKMARGVLARK